MNRTTYLPALAAVLIATAISLPASADTPPPPDYTETCTLEQQQVAGLECVSCAVTYADFDACKNQYEPEGYTKKCKDWGASVFNEIYCKGTPTGTGGASGTGGAKATGGTPGTGGDQAEDTATTSEESSGCVVAPALGSRLLAPLALLIGAALVGFAARRRAGR